MSAGWPKLRGCSLLQPATGSLGWSQEAVTASGDGQRGSENSRVTQLQPCSSWGWAILPALSRSTALKLPSCKDTIPTDLKETVFSWGNVSSLLVFLPMLCRDAASSSLLYKSVSCPVDKEGLCSPGWNSEHEWRGSWSFPKIAELLDFAIANSSKFILDTL